MDAMMAGELVGFGLVVVIDVVFQVWAIYNAHKRQHKGWTIGLIINALLGMWFLPVILHIIVPIIYLIRYRNHEKK